ncbi:MAG: restriction endonuclease, partial [Candidatus Electrothrix sp. AR1]|nr:restriction endonuclease [Candidatus Electrothrix sp. AR1]
MDSKPFFAFDMLGFQDHQVAELKKFTKAAFSLEDILTTASTLKYTSAIKKILEKELANPTESFVRFFASQILDGRLTKPVIEQFTEIVKEARKQFINEKINERIKSALSVNDVSEKEEKQQYQEEQAEQEEDNGIVTTEEEIEGYHVVKAILRETVEVSRVV